MVKSPATFTIEREVLRQLGDYVGRWEDITGGRKSKSSVVEGAIIRELYRLNVELSEFIRDKPGDISITR